MMSSSLLSSLLSVLLLLLAGEGTAVVATFSSSLANNRDDDDDGFDYYQYPMGRDAAEIYRSEQARYGLLEKKKTPLLAEENAELDCGMRRLFLEKSESILSWRSKESNQDIEDALEIKKRCSKSELEATTTTTTSSRRSLRTSQNYPAAEQEKEEQEQPEEGQSKKKQHAIFYVCPETGKDEDDQSGNVTHPFLTLHKALEATRAVSSSGSNDKKEIVLKPGIHFLKKPIVLKPKDSNLVIRSAHVEADKRAWLSGGTFIDSKTAKWFPMIRHPHIWIAHNLTSLLEGKEQDDITGLFTVCPHHRMTLARYPNANVEEWDAQNRYDTIDVKKTNDEWIFPPHGKVPDYRSSYLDLTDPTNPTGFVKNDSHMNQYNQYGTGIGGVCSSVWGPGDLPSYWCGNVSAGGWARVDRAAALAGRLNLPAGLHLESNSKFQQRVAKHWLKEGGDKHIKGGIFHVAHSQGWAWHMFNISSVESKTTTTTDGEASSINIHFDTGGWQGGRNWECFDRDGRLTDCNGDDKKLHGGPWYVEGILEELDAPGEFYFDRESKKLYFYPPDCKNENNQEEDKPATCFPPDLIATNLKHLIEIRGTQEKPVHNIQIKGVGFRDAAKTYMTEQWSAPSGGDWSLYRGGAIHIEGSTNITIQDCSFQRLDGNAILLGGYNRYFRATQSEFNWLGDGAMATWGDTHPTKGYDATQGNQPRFSLVDNNVVSNLGLYEKQSSPWGQNKACRSTIRNNVMYNLPRAAINFNDGLGGDNLVEGNVIFNTCRESGDHGPINSWDRMPFLHDLRSGKKPSFSPLPTHTRHNLILANYGASQGFDNDDGSSWYYTHENVYYQGDGFKMDYGGHSSKFYNNLVYSDTKACYGTGSFLRGQADIFSNNTCIVARTDKDRYFPPELGHLYQCNADYGMIPTNNRYYAYKGNATFACGGSKDLSLQQMQQTKGMEINSTLQDLPKAETVLSWAKDLLAPGFRRFH